MRCSKSMMSAMALMITVSSRLAAHEDAVPLDKLPVAVVDAVKGRFPNSTVISASKEKVKGEELFEVLINQPEKATKEEKKPKPQEIEISLGADGKIHEIESKISFEQLPKLVRDAATARFPKAIYKAVESIVKMKDGKELPTVYEATLVTEDKHTMEIVWAEDGKVLEEEKKSQEKDDEDHENNKEK